MFGNKASYDDFYPSDDWSLTATLDSGDVGVDAELVIINPGGAKAEGYYDGRLVLTRAAGGLHSPTSQAQPEPFKSLKIHPLTPPNTP